MDFNDIMNKRVGFGKGSKIQLFFIYVLFCYNYSTLRCSGIVASMIRNEQLINYTDYTIFLIFIVFAAICGSFLCEQLTNKISRLKLINIMTVITLVLNYFSIVFDHFIIFAVIRVIQFTFMQTLIISCQPCISELTQHDNRNFYFILLYCSLSVGSVIPVFIAQSFYDNFGFGDWKYLIFTVSTIFLPFIITSLMYHIESPRYLLQQKQLEQAVINMNQLGVQNNSSFEMINDDEIDVLRIHTYRISKRNSNVINIFSDKNRIISLVFLKLTLQIHLLINFFILPQILRFQHYNSVWYDYIALYLCFLGQILSAYSTYQLVNSFLGRKKTIIISSLLMAVFVIFLSLLNKYYLLLFLFLQSAAAQVLFQSYGIVVSELYTTENRAKAFTYVATIGRITELFIPFILTYLDEINAKYVFLFFIPINILTAILFYFFIPETQQQDVDYINPIIKSQSNSQSSQQFDQGYQ